jgi:hypothetical protein
VGAAGGETFQRIYRQIGNAVPPPLVAAIGEAVMSFVERRQQRERDGGGRVVGGDEHEGGGGVGGVGGGAAEEESSGAGRSMRAAQAGLRVAAQSCPRGTDGWPFL